MAKAADGERSWARQQALWPPQRTEFRVPTILGILPESRNYKSFFAARGPRIIPKCILGNDRIAVHFRGMQVMFLGFCTNQNSDYSGKTSNRACRIAARDRRLNPARSPQDSGLNQTLTNGVTDQVGRLVDIELIHDPRAMTISGLDADSQTGRDLLGGVPLGN